MSSFVLNWINVLLKQTVVYHGMMSGWGESKKDGCCQKTTLVQESHRLEKTREVKSSSKPFVRWLSNATFHLVYAKKF